MKKIFIPFLDIAGIPSPEDVGELMGKVPFEPILQNPWPEYAHGVKAGFRIAHNVSAVFLKYEISESHVLARSYTNGDVHKDSCVEFFMMPEGDTSYYNLEFNSLGWCKAAYGPNARERNFLPPEHIHSIRSMSKILHEGNAFNWNIMLVIPAAVFNISSFSDLKATGNFYKCGDEMPEMHFLTWNMVRSAKPDFHRKADFGELHFLEPGEKHNGSNIKFEQQRLP